jgi:NADPH-dependent 2,4-dienoyl-CoA reductase/sulfur reductase-like enzyme
MASSLGAEPRRGRVAEVDADRRRVLLADGDHMDYDVLVLAPGARPRRVIDTTALTLFGDAGPAATSRVVTCSTAPRRPECR